MANPQVENGYTKIATELLKEIYYRITNATHLRIVLFVIRFTYGYNRKEFETNVTSIGKSLGISPDYCRSMLIDLSDKCQILKCEWKNPKVLTISLVKDYEHWMLD